MAKMLSTANYTQQRQREIVQWLLFSTRVNLKFVLELLCTTYRESYPVHMHYVKIAVLVATKPFWQWSGNFKVTLGAYLSQAAWKGHKLCLVIWLLQDITSHLLVFHFLKFSINAFLLTLVQAIFMLGLPPTKLKAISLENSTAINSCFKRIFVKHNTCVCLLKPGFLVCHFPWTNLATSLVCLLGYILGISSHLFAYDQCFRYVISPPKKLPTFLVCLKVMFPVCLDFSKD